MNENEKRDSDKPHIRTTTDVTLTTPIRIDITHRLGDSWFWMIVVVIAVIIFFAQLLRADTTKVFQAKDSTFIPIEPQSAPAWACKLMCPSCGHCVPIKIPDDQLCCPEYFGITFMCRAGKAEGWSNTFNIAPGCKDILWGHWAGTFVDRHLWPDSIFTTKDSAVVRARGLDSVYTLPHDTIICRDLGNAQVSNNRGAVYPIIFKPCDTIKIPGHWRWFDWKNGKRVNIRDVPGRFNISVPKGAKIESP